MQIDTLINKIALSIREFNVPLKTALQQAYAAGHEDGRKSLFMHGEKEVIEHDADMNEIQRYPSVVIAAKKKKVDKTTLYLAIREGRGTRDGHIWKYAEI